MDIITAKFALSSAADSFKFPWCWVLYSDLFIVYSESFLSNVYREFVWYNHWIPSIHTLVSLLQAIVSWPHAVFLKQELLCLKFLFYFKIRRLFLWAWASEMPRSVFFSSSGMNGSKAFHAQTQVALQLGESFYYFLISTFLPEGSCITDMVCELHF